MTQPLGSWPPPGNPPQTGWTPAGQYPPPPGPPQPPWGPPTTQPLSNRDPFAPMGADKPASVSIDQFATPRSRAPWVIVGVVIVVLAGLFWMGSGNDLFAATAGGDSRQRTEVTTVPSISANGVEFHSTWDDADGVFEILDSTWTSRGLELDVRIRVASGSSFTFGFFALDNATTDEYIPIVSSENGYLNPGTVRAGESVRGKVVFPKDRGDTTVILADSTDRQVTALGVRG